MAVNVLEGVSARCGAAKAGEVGGEALGAVAGHCWPRRDGPVSTPFFE